MGVNVGYAGPASLKDVMLGHEEAYLDCTPSLKPYLFEKLVFVDNNHEKHASSHEHLTTLSFSLHHPRLP